MPHQGQLALGAQGLALLRLWLVGDEQEVADCIRETIAIAHAIEAGDTSELVHVPEFDVRAGYSQWAQRYGTVANPIIQLEESVVRGLLDGLAPGRAIDVACGTGRHLAWLGSIGHAVVGVDLTFAMLAQVQGRAERPHLCAGDMQALPFRSESFDIAVSALALTHSANLQAPIKELARVVRPGGRVVISDVHPFAVLTGAQAGFRASEGLAFVRNHVHLHGDYLTAFASAGLKVRGCVEPAIGQAEIAIMVGEGPPSDPIAPTIDRYCRAYLGLPAVLIWDLERM